MHKVYINERTNYQSGKSELSDQKQLVLTYIYHGGICPFSPVTSSLLSCIPAC